MRGCTVRAPRVGATSVATPFASSSGLQGVGTGRLCGVACGCARVASVGVNGWMEAPLVATEAAPTRRGVLCVDAGLAHHVWERLQSRRRSPATAGLQDAGTGRLCGVACGCARVARSARTVGSRLRSSRLKSLLQGAVSLRGCTVRAPRVGATSVATPFASSSGLQGAGPGRLCGVACGCARVARSARTVGSRLRSSRLKSLLQGAASFARMRSSRSTCGSDFSRDAFASSRGKR